MLIKNFTFSIILLFSLLLIACRAEPDKTLIEFWAMGREGEKVQALLPEFEKLNPNIRVKVQQIPWSAAHEKLLTAYAGDTLPDVFQLGNTWIPEFVILGAVATLNDRFDRADPAWKKDYFEGILKTNEMDGQLFGIPWYVDTRLIFYRIDILAKAGFSTPPRTWQEWDEALARIKTLPGSEHYALLLPMNEWQVPVILALQQQAELLRESFRFGNFQSEAFRRAFSQYLDLFRHGYAPAWDETQLANLYQEFARGAFAMMLTGPWNIGEFEQRLPNSVQKLWTTAPLPGANKMDPGLSLAGGASLALAAKSDHQEESWKLIEFLSAPERQVEFYRLTGDLPSRRSTWKHPDLIAAHHARAFRIQLERVIPAPQIPEWERIADKIAHYAELAVRNELTANEALAALDRDVDLILAKRRWLMDRANREKSFNPHPAPLTE
jgi:multiple sugar transport system substrate-binding protein